MSDLISELAEIEKKAHSLHETCNAKSIQRAFEKLIKAANDAELAHSGSWIGYQACVYYNDLERPPNGAFFDKQWGLQDRFSNSTVGEWVEYRYSEIYDHLKGLGTKTNPTLDELYNLMQDVSAKADDLREDLLAVIEACRAVGTDEYLERLKEDAAKARLTAPDRYVHSEAPKGSQVITDARAIGGGMQTPPHVAFRAMLFSIRSLFNSVEEIAKVAKRTRTHLSRKAKAT